MHSKTFGLGNAGPPWPPRGRAPPGKLPWRVSPPLHQTLVTHQSSDPHRHKLLWHLRQVSTAVSADQQAGRFTQFWLLIALLHADSCAAERKAGHPSTAACVSASPAMISWFSKQRLAAVACRCCNLHMHILTWLRFSRMSSPLN